MALTAEQKTELQESVADVKAGLTEIQGVVYDSLSIQNVGGSHIYNLGVTLQKKIDALQEKVEALEV